VRFAARVRQGLSIGAASGPLTATLSELEPNGNRHRAALVSTVSSLGGLGAGPLLSGSITSKVEGAWACLRRRVRHVPSITRLGDVRYVTYATRDYIENTGDTPLRFLPSIFCDLLGRIAIPSQWPFNIRFPERRSWVRQACERLRAEASRRYRKSGGCGAAAFP
jgi:MFS family permease